MAKTHQEIMEILEAFDLTRSQRAAAELAGCDHTTVAHYVERLDTGYDPYRRARRPRLVDVSYSPARGRYKAEIARYGIMCPTSLRRRQLFPSPNPPTPSPSLSASNTPSTPVRELLTIPPSPPATPVLPKPTMERFDREIERLAVLEDPVRRSLYWYVVDQGDYVSRDQAAAAVGVARGLAAFHLDKLARAELLQVTYRRLAGRVGPHAGRPSKLYKRSRAQMSISLPRRDYAWIASLLAQGLDQAPPRRSSPEVERAAGDSGAALGQQARSLAGRRPGRRALLEAGLEVLRRAGFEPRFHNQDIRLSNCPFDTVAREYTALVCSVNLAIMEGFIAALKVKGLVAQFDPRDDGCCVVFGGAAWAAGRLSLRLA